MDASVLVALVVLVPLALIAAWVRNVYVAERTADAKKQLKSLLASDAASAVESGGARPTGAPGALPAIPEDLVDAIVRSECVLYWGGGVSAQAGYPTWPEAVSTIVERSEGSDLKRILDAGRLSIVVELLMARIQDRARVVEAFSMLWSAPKPVPALARGLVGLGFSNVVTSTWDSLPEQAFTHRRPVVVHGVSSEHLDALLSPKEFCIVKLWGSVERRKSLLLTHSEYRSAITGNPEFDRYITSLALSRTHMFIGASLSTIEEYLEGMPREQGAKTHYAIVHETPDIALQQEIFSARHGVKLLVFKPTPGFPELSRLVSAIARATEKKTKDKDLPAVQPMKIDAVTLVNIGPFTSQTVEFGSAWHMLLGNNGSGKSTILRAIALCLCGDDPKAAVAGGRLLRTGAAEGSIELRIGSDTFRSSLRRTGDGVQVSSVRVTPFKSGIGAVLAFPPLRGVSTGDPIGPTSPGAARPIPEDVLPILEGPTDMRMNNVKQWLVNLDVLSTPGDNVSYSQAVRNQELRDKFFHVLRDFVPGSKVEFRRVERPSWKVIVETEDGEVGIDQVSQGMSSILGWVGPLLQRIYEINEDPEEAAAVVLIDEIDAHLHPEWQQRIVGTLKKHFPHVQFIATTHSPLIVGELERGQIHRAYRLKDRAVVEPLEQDPQGMGFSGVLTSEMFGMKSQLDLATQGKLARRRDLALIPNLKAEEEEEFRRLGEELGDRDYAEVIRDPLYSRFVKAMTSRKWAEEEGAVAPDELEAHRLRVAEEVLREVKEAAARSNNDSTSRTSNASH